MGQSSLVCMQHFGAFLLKTAKLTVGVSTTITFFLGKEGVNQMVGTLVFEPQNHCHCLIKVDPDYLQQLAAIDEGIGGKGRLKKSLDNIFLANVPCGSYVTNSFLKEFRSS